MFEPKKKHFEAILGPELKAKMELGISRGTNKECSGTTKCKCNSPSKAQGREE